MFAAQHVADVASDEQKKSLLLAEAEAEIEWRQYAVNKGIATDEEIVALDEWRMYLVMLRRTSSGGAFPKKPTE